MSIFVDNYQPSDFVPRGIVNLIKGRGLASAKDVPRRVCLIGMSSPDFKAELCKPVQVTSERPRTDEDSAEGSATDLFGAGSELHLMCRAAFQAYPGVNLWAVPLEAPVEAEDTYVTAAGKLILTGTSRRVGEWTIVIHGTPITVRIEKEQTADKTLNAIAAALNERDDLPIQPLSIDEDGTCTDVEPGKLANQYILPLKARHVGANGNDIRLFRRGGVGGQSLSVEKFVDGKGDAALSADSVDALVELLKFKERFHYLALANKDAPSLGQINTYLDTAANPIEGKRQQAIFGLTGDLVDAGSATELAEELNSARMQCVWSRGSAMLTGELSASVAAHRAWMEGSYPAANLCGHVIVGVPRPRLSSDLPTQNELNFALHHGVTPLMISGTEMAIVRSVTTRCKNDSGAFSYEVLDTNKVTTSDYVADDLEIRLQDRFHGFKLSPSTDASLPAMTATPATIRDTLTAWLREYEQQRLLRNVNESAASIRVELDDVDGRFNFELPEAVVDICATTAGNLIRY